MSLQPLPRWLPLANRLVKGVSRIGVALGTVQVLTVPGRVSGQPRSTPVSPLMVGGREYVIAGVARSQWAENVRAAGHGTLARARRRRPVQLREVKDLDLRRAVMRAFPREVPGGVPFFVRLGLVSSGDPDQFAAAADRVKIFEVLEGTLPP
ncbi:nitroreductase/quinone reductase family protein [Cryptosporangium sp. NPDC048952]|uniref:nitroreductase/quinone reductase family protein n=1 Tax=Cryptosporangium sp. NPDC048952 TaxID=3363961 RepID=UPI0037204383